MTLKADLIAARALIDTPEKWWRGSTDSAIMWRWFFFPIEKHCVVTAFNEISPDYSTKDFKRRMAMSAALKYQLPKFICGNRALDQFNDAPTTTHADIMSLFQRAIDNAGERE